MTRKSSATIAPPILKYSASCGLSYSLATESFIAGLRTCVDAASSLQVVEQSMIGAVAKADNINKN
jgi:hypothetical protein